MKLIKITTWVSTGKISSFEMDTTEMYLDYRNNFLTVKRFSEHYGISENLANAIIDSERVLHNIYSTFQSELNITI